MNLTKFIEYTKRHAQWKNKPDTSTPIMAEDMDGIEGGIKANNEAIKEIAAAVVSQIVNDPNKIASMAALYSVNQAVNQINSDFADVITNFTCSGCTRAYGGYIKSGRLIIVDMQLKISSATASITLPKSISHTAQMLIRNNASGTLYTNYYVTYGGILNIGGLTASDEISINGCYLTDA